MVMESCPAHTQLLGADNDLEDRLFKDRRVIGKPIEDWLQSEHVLPKKAQVRGVKDGEVG